MPTHRLPSDPSLEHLKGQARALQQRVRAGDAAALAVVREHHPRLTRLVAGDVASVGLKLADAQLAIARMYGHPSWPRLRAYVEVVGRYSSSPHQAPAGSETPEGRADDFLRLACLTYGGDDPARRERARALLAEHPEIARASIHTIAAVGEIEAARTLLARDPEQARLPGGPHRWEPILYLAYARIDDAPPDRSTLAVARLLLEHGSDPNAGFLWEGASPPFTALTGLFGGGEGGATQPPHQHALELARLLLEAGADPNDEQTLYNRHFEPEDDHLELLFASGLGTGDGGPWHRRLAPGHATPRQMLEDQLRFAAGNDRPERVALLLAHGVAADGRGTEHPIHRGRSALEVAIASGSSRVAELLVEAGATRPRLDDVDELIAAAVAGRRERSEALIAADATLLERAIARTPGSVITAAEFGRVEAVRLLVRLGFPVNAMDRRSPLHEAAWRGDLPLIETLLELGADARARDLQFGSTPAGFAEHGGHAEIAAFLARRERE